MNFPSQLRTRSFTWSLLLTVVSSAPAWSQVIDTTTWVPNGEVDAVARIGNTIYLAGSFTRIGPASGGGVPIDGVTGAFLNPFPKVAGWVLAVVPDGAGGWYIGGSFTAVGDIPRLNLAHILSNGTVAAWNPGANYAVHALAVNGSAVYAGGEFTQVGGQPRAGIAAIDATTGVVTTWDPHAVGPGLPTI